MSYRQFRAVSGQSVWADGLARATIGDEQKQVAALASMGGLLLFAGLAIVVLFPHVRSLVFGLFIFMSLCAPPAVAFLLFLQERNRLLKEEAANFILLAAKSILLCLVLTVIASVVMSATDWLGAGGYAIAFVASAAAVVFGILRRSTHTDDLSDRLDGWLIAVTAVAVFVLSPYDPANRIPIGLVDYALDAPYFVCWLVVGSAWTYVGVWLRRHEAWAFPRSQRFLQVLAVTMVALVVLGLYDDGHYVDFFHYEPLVDPALHALRGGIPMVDTYSQYGFLPWFIYYLSFSVLPPTFGTAAVVLRLINLAYFIVIVLIVVCASRRKLSALWFLIPAFLIAVTSHDTGPAGMWNMHALPMTLGGRWLLPALMTLLLVLTQIQALPRWAALTVLVPAALSSVDILACTLAPWGVCLMLDAVRARSPSMFFRWISLAAATVVGSNVLFAAVVYLKTGAVVDYGPYFDLISQYRPDEGSFWSKPFVKDYAIWLPIGLSCFLVLSVAALRALRGEKQVTAAERLLPAAVMTLGPLAYFFGRPQEATLNIACLSFAVVAIGIAERIFCKASHPSMAWRVLSVVMMMAFSFAIADGFEHFMRPLDPSRGNASILRRCFTEQRCHPAGVFHNVDLALNSQSLDPQTNVGGRMRLPSPFEEVKRVVELTEMVNRLAKDSRHVGLITDFGYEFGGNSHAISVTALMDTDRWHAWSVTSPFFDGLSPVISSKILQHVARTRDGEVVIISNRRNGLAPLNRSILRTLEAHCQLAIVETRHYHSAYQTMHCSNAAK
jgi:hypothetical protein